jgi:subtilisin family serine protease
VKSRREVPFLRKVFHRVEVDRVEPNYIIRADGATQTKRSDPKPNDPLFTKKLLWGLENEGQTVNGSKGVPGVDANAAQAWRRSTGSRQVVVGILDSGIELEHPDLVANLWCAPSQFTVEIGGQPLTFAAGSHGFDATHRTLPPIDDSGHGTHVAGIIGAVGNNGLGTVGVNFSVSLMPIKFLGGDNKGCVSNAIDAIEFAVEVKKAFHGDVDLRVLNSSWGISSRSSSDGCLSNFLRQAIEDANSQGMLFVASAGETSGNNDDPKTPHYPSNYDVPNVLAVTAVDNTGALAQIFDKLSNFGPNKVHLAAPGSSIMSTVPTFICVSHYDFMSGTSMAAAFVSGAAALILSQTPLNVANLKSVLIKNVTKLSSMSYKVYSGGVLNIGAAMEAALKHP